MKTDHGHPERNASPLSRAQRLQIAAITLGAAVLYAGFRLIPAASDLNHIDFRIDGTNTLEFCDPSNPQFIPVVAVRSPVSAELASAGEPALGTVTRHTLRLGTASRKPIGPADLLVVHTRPLHLLVVDPTLQDYQHVHPEPGAVDGEWVFEHRPQRAGRYRVFADFTPTATGRGLYASADFIVAGEESKAPVSLEWTTDVSGHRFTLTPTDGMIRAGRPATLSLALERPDGGEVQMEPIMDAYAHLVAFDADRSGFAHLHPLQTDPVNPADHNRPTLEFQVTIPDTGRYVIWAQVKLAGEEVFAPFWFDVTG